MLRLRVLFSVRADCMFPGLRIIRKVDLELYYLRLWRDVI